jgi:hypothetical protein
VAVLVCVERILGIIGENNISGIGKAAEVACGRKRSKVFADKK